MAPRSTSTKKAAARSGVRKGLAKAAPKTRRPSARSVDAIAYLKAEHREVERLFKAFEKAGDRALRTKGRLVNDMIKALSVHAAIEEQVLYPAIRREVEGAESDVLEALEEHHVAKWLLSELDGLAPSSERFEAKVTVLIENVRHHVREEESELFPEVRAALGRSRLIELGRELDLASRIAPTKPHPKSPSEPPGNLVVGAVAGVVDRARTVASGRRG